MIPEFELDGEWAAVEHDIGIVPEPPQDEDGNKELLTPLDLELYRHEKPNVPLIELREIEEEPADDESDPRAEHENDGPDGQDTATATKSQDHEGPTGDDYSREDMIEEASAFFSN